MCMGLAGMHMGWGRHIVLGKGTKGLAPATVSLTSRIQKMTLTVQVKQRGIQMTFEFNISLGVGPCNMQLMTQSQCISHRKILD
jgi:hypothetical protein